MNAGLPVTVNPFSSSVRVHSRWPVPVSSVVTSLHAPLFSNTAIARPWTCATWQTVRSVRVYVQYARPVSASRPLTLWAEYVTTVPPENGAPMAVASGDCHFTTGVAGGVPSGTLGGAVLTVCRCTWVISPVNHTTRVIPSATAATAATTAKYQRR